MSSNSRFAVAVHILTSLAFRDGKALSSSHLAASVKTNPVVIRRLLIQLRKAGLIHSLPGKAGGAQLARRADAITLWDVYCAVEGGSPFAIPDKTENKSCPVSCAMKKMLSSVLAETERAMSKSMESMRISDLLAQVPEARTAGH